MLVDESFFLTAIRSEPREARHRRAYSRWLSSQGRTAEAREQAIKSHQVSRFDPDLDYQKYVAPGLIVTTTAAGEIVVITDLDPPVWRLFVGAGELQETLRMIGSPPGQLCFADLPGELQWPSQALLESIFERLPIADGPRSIWGSPWKIEKQSLRHGGPLYVLSEEI